MKSPLRYSKWPIILYFLISFLIIGSFLNSFYLAGGVITLGRVLWSVGGVIFMTICGWFLAVKFTGTILHRKVDHLVEPYQLDPNVTYWLNGETQATYIGVMDYTGKYLFHVQGYHKKNDLLDAIDLFPDQVRNYISTQKEV